MIKVYSHPRSGTHFIEAFLAKNFYPDLDLELEAVEWGHWSNRKINPQGNLYGKLFGHHYFAKEDLLQNKAPKIYIYRDPRAVAYSIWKTDNFIHSELKGIPFSEFLSLKIDWEGSPGRKANPQFTIAEHWYYHVDSWHNKENSNLLIVKYEDLLKNPEFIFKQINKKFFPLKYLKGIFFTNKKVIPIHKPVGLLPNAATVDSWNKVFTKNDEKYFLSQLPNLKYLN